MVDADLAPSNVENRGNTERAYGEAKARSKAEVATAAKGKGKEQAETNVIGCGNVGKGLAAQPPRRLSPPLSL